MIRGSVVSIRISSFGGARFSTFELACAGLKSACDGGVRGSRGTCNSISCTVRVPVGCERMIFF